MDQERAWHRQLPVFSSIGIGKLQYGSTTAVSLLVPPYMIPEASDHGFCIGTDLTGPVDESLPVPFARSLAICGIWSGLVEYCPDLPLNGDGTDALMIYVDLPTVLSVTRTSAFLMDIHIRNRVIHLFHRYMVVVVLDRCLVSSIHIHTGSW